MFLSGRLSNIHRNVAKLTYSRFSVKANGCWKCDHTEIKNNFFCASCGVLRDTASNQDYFELLDVRKEFNIDHTQLTKKFRQIQNAIHPDKFSQKTIKEQTLAQEWSSLVNKAYQTLSKSTDRGIYLLELNGLVISDDNSTIDQKFLLEIMEINESVSEAENTEELQQLSTNITTDIDELTLKLAQSFNTNDLESAKNSIVRMKYLKNIETTIKEKILRLTIES